MTILSVYAVFANDEEADRICPQMVEERLAACVNILPPVRSFYRWQGQVECAAETAAIFKTAEGRADALIARIAELHSYDVPCIVSTPVEKALARYADWVEDSTR